MAALPTLCEYCLPFVRPGGRFIALKGPDADRELAQAAAAIRLLGGEVTGRTACTLDAGDGSEPATAALRIDKRRPTPAKYRVPRQK